MDAVAICLVRRTYLNVAAASANAVAIQLIDHRMKDAVNSLN